MKIPPENEVRDAAVALSRWFESQNIGRGTAGVIMAYFLASDIAMVAKNEDDLRTGYVNYGKMLWELVSAKYGALKEK